MPKSPFDEGEFKLTFKAYASEIDTFSPFHNDEKTDDTMKIRGIASGPNADLHDDIMSENTIKAFEKAIQDGILLPNGEWSMIPLRSGHRTNWDDILGWVTKAALDEEKNLWIEAELDDDSSSAQHLYKKLTKAPQHGRPVQLGLSVGGRITKYRKVFDPSLQKELRILENVALKEISVVGAPAYPTAYVEAIAKSLEKMSSEDTTEENDMLKLDQMLENRRQGLSALDGIEDVSKNETEATEAALDTTSVVTNDESVDDVNKNEEAAVTTESENEDEVAKEADTEVSSTEEALNNEADPQAGLAAIVKALSDNMASLTEALSRTQNPQVDAEVSKSEEQEAEETDVTKNASSDTEQLQALVNTAVTKAVSDVLTPLLSEITVIKSAVQEIQTQPIDQSLSVHKSKEDEQDPFEIFKSDLAAKKIKDNDLISAGIHASFNRNR